ncbi:MAG TPA: RHS repeat-associated core domain-containing protein [Dokdonella sp.]|uniref:RHS repeat-associated core domain-containing protein n=1 Tax=Dokdonella sp. TaxID=2291710 RepID=UPI002C6DB99D|nr:RHS repeat-associated core domain-containing protein [Dokdonella sp.]HUD43666.1 RHS repeat-associated core domain-containing protein [Dokdonella sp.]
MVSETPWPSPPLSTFRVSSINDVSFPSGTGGFGYSNSYFFSDGHPRQPFNKSFTIAYERRVGSVCQDTIYDAYVIGRTEVYSCETGLLAEAGPINAQNFYTQDQLVDPKLVCASGKTAWISAYQIPSRQCTYENPCIPANGSKTQAEVDYRLGLLSIARTYNSLRLTSPSRRFGQGWSTPSSERIIAPNSSPTHVLHADEEGYLDRYDRQGTTDVYRSINMPGSVLTRLGTTGWELSKVGEQVVRRFDSSGRILTVEAKGSPQPDIVYTYASARIDLGSGMFVPYGELQKITDAFGRSLDFVYGFINTSPASCTLDVECSNFRLLHIGLPDGDFVSYTYDAAGNLASVTYPDGSGRQYHYNEAANICPTSMPGACTGGTVPVGGFPHLLTGISDVPAPGSMLPVSRFATYQYDHHERVISSSHAGGVDRLELAYTGPAQATLTLPSGKQRVIDFTTGLFRKERAWLDTDTVTGTQRTTTFTFDTAVRPVTMTDPRGVVRTYEYSANGLHRTATINATGTASQQRIESDWDSTLNVVLETRRKDAASNVVARVVHARNARGQATATCEIDPADTAAMAYTCSATAAPPTGAKVRRTVMTYCESADVTLGTCPLVGLLVSVNGPRVSADAGMSGLDDVTTYTYRAADDPTCASAGACTYRKGDLWKVTNALGHVVETVSYDKNGRITRAKDANGTLTDFSYHPRGWLATRTVRANASGFPSTDDATTTLAYDAVGNVTRVTQPDGSYLDYGYDAAHRLLSVTDNLGNTLDYCPGGVGTANCLDGAGNRVVEETRNGASLVKRTLRRTYDQLGQLTSQINAQNQATQTWPTLGGYDDNGNPTQVVDGLGVETRQSYDPLNRLTQTIRDYLGPDLATRDTTTGYGYDARDNLVSVTDPDGLTTTYTYDGLNDQTGLSSPDTGSTAYTYDAAGNRRTQTDARGIVTTYTYDALNRLTGISYPTSTLNTSYAYDQPDGTTGCSGSYPAGRLTRITEETGTTTYCYDRRGNVTRKRQLMSATLSLYTVDYTWTKADRLATLTYPSGGIATYTRNTIGQISGITWKANASATPQTLVSSATYYPFGPLNVLTYGNGRTLTKTYDQDYAIDAIQSSHVDGLKMDLTVDVMGNIVDGTDVIGGSAQVTYSYDRLYRLTGSTAGAAPVEAFTYGPTGDRLSKTVGAGTPQAYTYASGSHRLASVGGVGRSHDANGNLTAAPFASPMAYDDRNRLARITVGTEKISYHYNGRGERVHKLRDLTREEVVHDESGKRLHSFVQSTSGFGTNAFREYVYLDDVPVATVDAVGIAYLETDHLGTPRVAADPATNAWRWRWNFFGTAFGEHAPTVPASGALALDLRYPGQAYDAETGLHYNYFRDYEPGTGRYIESDPIGLNGGLNTYRYSYVNPLVFFDKNGLSPCTKLFCIPGFKGERLVGSDFLGEAWRYDGFHEYVTNMPPRPPTRLSGRLPRSFHIGKRNGVCLITKVEKYSDTFQVFRNMSCMELCLGCVETYRWSDVEEILGYVDRIRVELENYDRQISSFVPVLDCIRIIESLQ